MQAPVGLAERMWKIDCGSLISQSFIKKLSYFLNRIKMGTFWHHSHLLFIIKVFQKVELKSALVGQCNAKSAQPAHWNFWCVAWARVLHLAAPNRQLRSWARAPKGYQIGQIQIASQLWLFVKYFDHSCLQTASVTLNLNLCDVTADNCTSRWEDFYLLWLSIHHPSQGEAELPW